MFDNLAVDLVENALLLGFTVTIDRNGVRFIFAHFKSSEHLIWETVYRVQSIRSCFSNLNLCTK